MSKALEAAHEAGVEAFKVRFSADCSAVDALTDYRDALLAHLAEDEAVVERVAEVFLSEARAYHEAATMLASTFTERAQAQLMLDELRFEKSRQQARQYARAALRTLAGKE